MSAGNHHMRNLIDREKRGTKLTKKQWIEMYGGQAAIEEAGVVVVPCVDCDDPICHGWRVEVKRPTRER